MKEITLTECSHSDEKIKCQDKVFLTLRKRWSNVRSLQFSVFDWLAVFAGGAVIVCWCLVGWFWWWWLAGCCSLAEASWLVLVVLVTRLLFCSVLLCSTLSADTISFLPLPGGKQHFLPLLGSGDTGSGSPRRLMQCHAISPSHVLQTGLLRKEHCVSYPCTLRPWYFKAEHTFINFDWRDAWMNRTFFI